MLSAEMASEQAFTAIEEEKIGLKRLVNSPDFLWHLHEDARIFRKEWD